MFKRFMRSKAVQVCLGALLASYMVLVKYTTRWRTERFEVAAPVIGTDEGFIGLTWHSRFLMLNAIWKKKWQTPHVLISLSRDGAVVTYTTRFLRLNTIRGSARKVRSSPAKGGSTAMRKMMKVLDAGDCIVITPDGPRGPRQRLGDGPLKLAKMTGQPILTCAMSVKNRIAFKSWDRFILPLPFGRGHIIWGTPVRVPSDADDDEMNRIREQIETEMNTCLADADRAMGHEPVKPAEIS